MDNVAHEEIVVVACTRAEKVLWMARVTNNALPSAQYFNIFTTLIFLLLLLAMKFKKKENSFFFCSGNEQEKWK